MVKAVNNSGFNIASAANGGRTTGSTTEFVKSGQTVNLKAGTGVAIDQAGKDFTFSVNAQGLANTAQLPVVYTQADGTKVYLQPDNTFNTALDGTGTQVQPANVIASMQNAAGSTTAPTTLSNVASTLPVTQNNTAAAGQPSNATTAQAAPTLTTAQQSNAATVGDVLNSGWNLQGNGVAKDLVKPYDTVNFVNGTGTTATVTTAADGSTSNIGYNVNTDGVTTQVNSAGQVVAVTAPITSTGGVASVTAPANSSSLATAGDVVKAVNNSGFTLTAEGKNGSLVKPGSTMDMKNTDGNIVISKPVGSNVVNYDLAKVLKVDSVTAGNTVLNNAGVTVTGGANGPVSLSNAGLNNGGNKLLNVATGTAPTDGVNVSQLTTQANAAKTQVNGGTNVANVTRTIGSNGQDIYTVNANGASVSNTGTGLVLTPTTSSVSNTTDYALDLSSTTKTSLGKADSALQTVQTQIDGKNVKTINQGNNTANFVTGKNMVLTPDANGGIKVATADDVNFNTVTAGTGPNQVILGNAGVTVGGNTYITGNGINANNRVITNVAAGKNATDAVNVSQLTQVVNNSIANNVTTPITGSAAADAPLSDAFLTYNVAQQATTDHQNILQTVQNMNSKGIKYFHTNSTDTRIGSFPHATDDSSAGAERSTAVGVNAIIDSGSTAAIALGDNIVVGNTSNAATQAVALGSELTVLGKNAIAVGQNAQALATNAISIGNGNIVSGVNSGAFGDPSVVSGTNSYSVGNNNTVATNNTFVVGNNVTNTVDNSVILGNNSAANAALFPSSAGMTTYKQDTIRGTTYQYAGGTPAGIVSVGAVGAERRVQNVAAGQISATSTDAINGSQLYATNQAINNLSITQAQAAAPWNLTANGNTTAVAPGSTVNVVNGTNTTAVLKGNQLQVNMVDNPTFAGPVTMNGGMTVAPNQTVSMGGNVLQNVGTGVKPTDAVNVSQLQAVSNVANAGFNLSANGDTASKVAPGGTVTVQQGQNITVTRSATDPNSLTVATVASPKFGNVTVNDAGTGKITGLTAGTAATDAVNVSQLAPMVKYDANADGSVNYNSVTLNPAGTAPTTIHQVAAGTANTDAVNVSQLNAGVANAYNQSKNYTDAQINNLNGEIGKLKDSYRGATASAMAMASLPQPFLPGKNMVSVGAAGYQNQYGIAVGVSGITDNGRWIYKGQVSGNSNSEFGVGAGLGYQW